MGCSSRGGAKHAANRHGWAAQNSRGTSAAASCRNSSSSSVSASCDGGQVETEQRSCVEGSGGGSGGGSGARRSLVCGGSGFCYRSLGTQRYFDEGNSCGEARKPSARAAPRAHLRHRTAQLLDLRLAGLPGIVELLRCRRGSDRRTTGRLALRPPALRRLHERASRCPANAATQQRLLASTRHGLRDASTSPSAAALGPCRPALVPDACSLALWAYSSVHFTLDGKWNGVWL